jgi:hypothetical protein
MDGARRLGEMFVIYNRCGGWTLNDEEHIII